MTWFPVRDYGLRVIYCLVLDRCQLAEATLAPFPVLAGLDPRDHRQPQLLPCGPFPLVQNVLCRSAKNDSIAALSAHALKCVLGACLRRELGEMLGTLVLDRRSIIWTNWTISPSVRYVQPMEPCAGPEATICSSPVSGILRGSVQRESHRTDDGASETDHSEGHTRRH